MEENGENQRGEGVPLTHGMNDNQLDFAEITYIQLDGTHFTIRTNSIQAGFMLPLIDRTLPLACTEPESKKNFYSNFLCCITVRVPYVAQ